jgi:hypothetical protein
MSTIKQIFSFVAIVAASALVSIAVGMAIILSTDNEEAGFSVMFFGSIIVALALGIFNK